MQEDFVVLLPTRVLKKPHWLSGLIEISSVAFTAHCTALTSSQIGKSTTKWNIDSKQVQRFDPFLRRFVLTFETFGTPHTATKSEDQFLLKTSLQTYRPGEFWFFSTSQQQVAGIPASLINDCIGKIHMEDMKPLHAKDVLDSSDFQCRGEKTSFHDKVLKAKVRSDHEYSWWTQLEIADIARDEQRCWLPIFIVQDGDRVVKLVNAYSGKESCVNSWSDSSLFQSSFVKMVVNFVQGFMKFLS
jgi:hypothetical protein